MAEQEFLAQEQAILLVKIGIIAELDLRRVIGIERRAPVNGYAHRAGNGFQLVTFSNATPRQSIS